ncbi:MAG TPA: hypothetical protein VF258_07220 [Luteolibacter sp.]
MKWILIPATAGILIHAILKDDHPLILLAMGLAGITVLTTIIQWIIAARTRCPLCMTPVLARKECAKHRNARAFLGSLRLRVALAILFKGSFRCPYCHEPSVLKLRTARS